MMQNDGAGFLSGASGGFFGSLGATAWGGAGGKWGGIAGKYAGSSVGTIAFRALSGGVGAELTGGNFWQGAVTGLFVSGLNHAAHEMSDGYGIDPPAKKDSTKIVKDRFKFVKNTSKSIEGIAEGFSSQGKAGKIVKFVGKHSGTLSTATEVGLNVYQYKINEISGARLTYRTVGTGLGTGAGIAVGGLPGFGLGLLVDLSFSSVELAYDTLASPIQSSFNQFINNVNFACANAQR